jgi:uncharacterized protein (DUF4415 family)
MKNTKPNPEMIDQDNPEITPADFDRAIPFAVFAKEHGLKIPKPGDTILVNDKPRVHRGRQKTPVKVAVSLRLHPDTLAAFRKSGRGWQTRIDAALAEYVSQGRLRKKS